jgi:hypothetical protein
MMVAQANEIFYHYQHLMNAFLPFAIEGFGCLPQQVDKFFH